MGQTTLCNKKKTLKSLEMIYLGADSRKIASITLGSADEM